MRYAIPNPVVLLLMLTLSACGDDPVAVALDDIDAILQGSHEYNQLLYSLQHDSENPCSAVLHERWRQGTTSWHQRYRFQLYDIEPGTFLVAKQGRPAISYEGERVSAKGDVKHFEEQTISNVQYRAGLYQQEQVEVLENMLLAIVECEYRFGLE